MTQKSGIQRQIIANRQAQMLPCAGVLMTADVARKQRKRKMVE